MIRNVEFNDLNEIAKLHTQSFENHFLPKLGLKLLANYYKEFIDDQNVFIVSIGENNKINGLLLGTPDSSVGRNTFIKSNKIGLSLRVLSLCFQFDKDTWVRVKGSLNAFFPKKKDSNLINSVSGPTLKTISLLSICVSKDSKGKGTSKALVEEFERRITTLGYEGYTLTVHKMNERANHFYEKIGMDIYKESDSEYGYVKQLI